MEYLFIKWVHVLSATVLFGTGLGSAFCKWSADRSGDLPHMARVNRHVVLADWLFTAPAVILQPLTGLVMVWMAGYPLNAPWIMFSILLYLFAGGCWVPAVVIQYRHRKLAAYALSSGAGVPPAYPRLARIWFWLGVLAFSALVAVFYLMVGKPA